MGGFAGKIIAVATGEFDACVNPATGKGGEWDECAPDIILEEAGGIITDLLGNRFTYNNEKFSENGYVVSNRELHDQIIEKIAPYV
jgi:myo-inositol-1(or 4)-monophosphatase